MTKTYAMAREVPDGAPITAGKPYLIVRASTEEVLFFDDNNQPFILRHSAFQPHGANWIRLTEVDALAIMVGQQHPNALGNNANSTDSAQSSSAPTIAVPADLWGEVVDGSAADDAGACDGAGCPCRPDQT